MEIFFSKNGIIILNILLNGIDLLQLRFNLFLLYREALSTQKSYYVIQLDI
jgi:hypothetical protein